MSKLNMGQIIKKSYDEDNNVIKVTNVPASGAPTPSKLDVGQIIKAVFDEDTQTIRISKID